MMEDKDHFRKVGNDVGSAIFVVFVVILLGTIAGIWIKLFWLGWVLAR